MSIYKPKVNGAARSARFSGERSPLARELVAGLGVWQVLCLVPPAAYI
jgi:hypothetical protein